jgi:hypothetical protein
MHTDVLQRFGSQMKMAAAPVYELFTDPSVPTYRTGVCPAIRILS